MTAGRLTVLAMASLAAACASSPEKDAASGADEQAVDAPVPVTVTEHPLPEYWLDE